MENFQKVLSSAYDKFDSIQLKYKVSKNFFRTKWTQEFFFFRPVIHFYFWQIGLHFLL